MDKLLLLLLLLLLAVFPAVFFRGVAPATVCMVCKIFQKGKCLAGHGNCTTEGPGCRTRDIFFFTNRDGWLYNHTQLDCSDTCKAWRLFHGGLKVSSFCCQGQDFCNIYRGKSRHWTRESY